MRFRRPAVLFLAALAAAAPAVADEFVPLDLSARYTVDGVAAADAPGAARFGGLAMGVPAEAFPPGDPASFFGIPFRLGSPEGNNVLVPEGQTLPVPEGRYRWLFVLGVSARDNAGGVVTFDYAEGPATFPLQFTSWMYSPQIGEVVACSSAYHYGPAGRVPSPVNLFMQLLPLDPDRTLRGVALPKVPDIQIFGLTLSAGDPLARKVHFGRVPLPAWEFCESAIDYRTGPREGAEWHPASPGHSWLGSAPFAWLKAKVRIPAEFEGLPVLCRALVRNGGPFINYYGGDVYLDGERFQGFSGNLAEVKVSAAAKAGEEHEVVIQFYTPEGQGRFIDAYLVPEPIDELSMLLRVLPPVLRFAGKPLPEGDVVGTTLWPKMENGFRAGGYPGAIAALRAALAEHAPLDADLDRYELHLFPNSHVDMEWLWTIEETERVLQNTFSGVCDYIDTRPFTFAQSQGSAYEIIEKLDPPLFERIRKHVASGAWALVGGMWCEPDMNMPSGEAICRHFLVTQDYFMKKFGRRTKVGWNPDTFGHSANAPQILKKSGIDYYVHFRPPSAENDGVYRWEGLDGTAVTAFRGPVWYIRQNVTPEEVLRDLQEFRDRYGTRVAASCYGVGDHGGVPPFSDAERAFRMDKLPVFPRVTYSTPEAFFEKFEAQRTKELKTIQGERNYTLRGCYVTHSNTKFNNRRGEWGLVSTEALATIVSALDPSYVYPAEGFTEAWKKVLFNQFHDILPGSAVPDAFARTIKNRYREVREFLAQTQNEAMARLAAKVWEGASASALAGASTDKSAPDAGEGHGGGGIGAGRPLPHVLVFNPLSWPYTGPVRVTAPVGWQEGDSTTSPGESGRDGGPAPPRYADTLLWAKDVPPLGYKVIGLQPRAAPEGPTLTALMYGLRVEGSALENEALRVEVDPKTGAVARILDKANRREVLAGPANGLEFREDIGNAWEIMYGPNVGEFGNIDTRGPATLLPGEKVLSVKTSESGPIRAAIEVVSDFRGSSLVRRVVLYAGSTMVHFEFARDWKSDCADVLVKAMFPLNVLKPVARSEIPYGSVERPADGAEVPAQTWLNVDEADGSYGVALLNNGRYGHSVKDATVGLSLLRDPKEGPDPQPEDASEGNHVLTYALYPHVGDWKKAQVLQRAWELNAPPLARMIDAAGANGHSLSHAGLVSVEPANVVLGAVKRELNGGGVVLRLVETTGAATKARVVVAGPHKPHRADILEDLGDAIPLSGVATKDGGSGGTFELDLAPFGIETVILK